MLFRSLASAHFSISVAETFRHNSPSTMPRKCPITIVARFELAMRYQAWRSPSHVSQPYLSFHDVRHIGTLHSVEAPIDVCMRRVDQVTPTAYDGGVPTTFPLLLDLPSSVVAKSHAQACSCTGFTRVQRPCPWPWAERFAMAMVQIRY